MTNAHGTGPQAPPPARVNRCLTKAREAFYDNRYEEAVERCQEALALCLPPEGGAASPEEQAELFLRRWGGEIPLQEAEKIAGVFAFFTRRKAAFRYERGRPLPRREWWQLLRIAREDAQEVLGTTQRALNAVKRAAAPAPGAD